MRRAKRLASGLAAGLLSALLPSAAIASEPDPELALDVEGLIHDLEKIVEIQISIGWKIDRYEYEEMMPDALLSVCRTTEDARSRAFTLLDERLERLGGPPDQAFRVAGGSLKGLDENLLVSRVRALLEEASRRASSECPFWIAPDPSFKGLQTDAHRFTISVEGGGLFTVQHWGGRVFELGAGGSGRLLLGYGLSHHWTLLGGAELGGTAIFDQTSTGTKIPLQFTGAVPVVVRRVNVTWHYDFEVAPVGFYAQGDDGVTFGMRGGFLIGVSTLRVRGIMPWFGVGIAVEYLFPTSARGGVTMLKGGARVGFDWDF